MIKPKIPRLSEEDAEDLGLDNPKLDHDFLKREIGLEDDEDEVEVTDVK